MSHSSLNWHSSSSQSQSGTNSCWRPQEKILDHIVSTAPLILIHHRGHLPSCLIMTRSHDSGNIPGRRASLNVKHVGQLPKLAALLCALSQPDHILSNPLSGRERKPRCLQRNFQSASHAMPSKTPSADAPSDSPPQQAAPPGGGSAAGQGDGGSQAAGKRSPTGSGRSSKSSQSSSSTSSIGFILHLHHSTFRSLTRPSLWTSLSLPPLLIQVPRFYEVDGLVRSGNSRSGC
jgi:hypothetical protein